MKIGLLIATLGDFLRNELVIIGIVLAAVGLALSFLSKRIAKSVRKSDEIKPTDTVMLTFKAFGLICIVVALVLITIEISGQ